MEKILKIEHRKKIIALLTLSVFIVVTTISCIATLYFGFSEQNFLLLASLLLLVLWGY